MQNREIIVNETIKASGLQQRRLHNRVNEPVGREGPLFCFVLVFVLGLICYERTVLLIEEKQPNFSTVEETRPSCGRAVQMEWHLYWSGERSG